jgi:CRP-like cAMP-binding protein
MTWKTAGPNNNDNIIRNIPFFSDLSNEEIELIESIIIKKNFVKDQIVLLEEESSNYMYIVYVGMVRVVKQSTEGREQILTIHKKNEFFGEMSILDGKTSPATVIAHEDAIIGLLSKNDFEQHLLSNEIIRKKIIERLCANLRESWTMIKNLSLDNAEQRILAVLYRMQELYGLVDDRGVIVNIKLTHQQIANYASVTRETVSRILKRFENDAVIQMLDGKKILLTTLFYERVKTDG